MKSRKNTNEEMSIKRDKGQAARGREKPNGEIEITQLGNGKQKRKIT